MICNLAKKARFLPAKKKIVSLTSTGLLVQSKAVQKLIIVALK